MKKLSVAFAIFTVIALMGCPTMLPADGLCTATKLPDMATGKIKTVHSVDWDAKNILGIYGMYKVIVTGQ